MRKPTSILFLTVAFSLALTAKTACGEEHLAVSKNATGLPVGLTVKSAAPLATSIASLDGRWQLALDPDNIGKREQWFARGPVAEARPATVPGVVDQVFPGGYEGVMWYWREFDTAPPASGERILLKFGAADYLADVWLNGKSAGLHEGGDTPFVVDITDLVSGTGKNRLVVRVLSPGSKAIDGLTKANTPQGYKNYWSLVAFHWNPGGLWQSVEVIRAPAIRAKDIFADARWRDGVITCKTTLVNDTGKAEKATVRYEVAPAKGGPIAFVQVRQLELPAGESCVEADLTIPNARAWSLDDPYLYRVTVRVESRVGLHDESVRCGFREFLFRDGFFRLNGKRIWLKSAHRDQFFPIGQHMPSDPGLLRREIVNLKAMGFNMVRIVFRSMHPVQLALCDELGFMVYEEHYGSWLMEYSPQHNERFDRSVRETILRDRNHPSLVMFGLLNETRDGLRFRHAVETLPLIRSLDPSRMVILSSGRWDRDLSLGSLSNPGSTRWDGLLGAEGSAVAKPSTEARSKPYHLSGAGDSHYYCSRPTPSAGVAFLRTVGDKIGNIFLSEFGHGNQMDPIELAMRCQQYGADPECVDAKVFRSMAEQFQSDWKRWGVDQVYANPSDLVKEAEQIGAEQWTEDLDTVRSNPKIAGFSLIAWTDVGYQNCGIVNLFGEPKRGMFDALREGFAPVHWCLFVGPRHIYRGAKVTVEAVLANEDALRPGPYPVRLRILGPAGVVCEKSYTLAIGDPQGKPEPPLALPGFKEEIPLDGPPGKYEIAVFFDGGAAARARRIVVVGDRQSLPKPSRPIVVWEKGGALTKWFTSMGTHADCFDPARPPTKRAAILLSGPATLGDAQAYQSLMTQVARGATAVILDPNVLVDPRQKPQQFGTAKRLDYLPMADRVQIGKTFGGWEGNDKVIKPHPVFAGLPSGCLMDLTYYRDLTPQAWFSLSETSDTQAKVIVPCFIINGRYAAGAALLCIPFGEGRIILSSLRLTENLGQHPAADRILLNLLTYTSRDLEKPLVPLSPESAEQIRRIGGP